MKQNAVIMCMKSCSKLEKLAKANYRDWPERKLNFSTIKVLQILVHSNTRRYFLILFVLNKK